MTSATHECEVSRPIAIDMYQWLLQGRSVPWRLLNHDDLRLGGHGPVHMVQIDESSHKPKVRIAL